MKKRCFLTCCLLMLGMALTAGAQTSNVPIDEEHFPDANFRQWVSMNFTPEEIPVATELNMVGSFRYKNTAEYYASFTYSIKGIEYFTSLEHVSFYMISASTIDLSKNTRLKSFSFNGATAITELNLSGCTELEDVLISGYLPGGVLSFAPFQKLRKLTIKYANLEALDVSENAELASLTVAYCDKMNTIDLSKNVKLDNLDLTGDHDGNGNSYTTLDLSANTELTSLRIVDCSMPALDLSANVNLTSLVLGCKCITSLDLSANTNLDSLAVGCRSITSLDLSQLLELRTLLVSSCENLTSLKLSPEMTKLGADKDINEVTRDTWRQSAVSLSWLYSLKDECMDAFIESLPVVDKTVIINVWRDVPITYDQIRKLTEKGWVVFYTGSDGDLYNTAQNPIATGIHSSGLSSQRSVGSPLFDLQGRRVQGTPQRGLYIRDGKKVLK